jgi:transposase
VRTAVGEYVGRTIRLGLGWPLPDGLTDEALEHLLFPPPRTVSPDRRRQPDWAIVHRQLRKKNVTLSLLWEEYRATDPDGYGYSRQPPCAPGPARFGRIAN